MPKDKPPAKRPERVGVKRGKYKPRDRPNWNKHIKDKEREERKAKAKAEKLEKEASIKQKRPPRARPFRPKPIVKSAFVSVPSEVLGLVAQYIAPTSTSLADGLAGPGEAPYPPLTQNVTASLKARNERWGTIPQFILDLINLSKCCRQTHEICRRILGGYGGSRPAPTTEPDKSEKEEGAKDAAGKGEMVFGEALREYTESPRSSPGSSPSPERYRNPESIFASRAVEVERIRVAWGKYTSKVAGKKDDKTHLYLRLSHAGQTGDNLFAMAIASGATLEHLVLHSCGGEHGTFSDASHRKLDNASPVNRSSPFQSGHTASHIALPRLRSVQIGPHVCEECMQACIRLVSDREFYSKSQSGKRLPSWVPSLRHAGYPSYSWSATTYEKVAAPNLEALQLYLPAKYKQSRYLQGSPHSDVFALIGPQIRRTLRTFSLILPPNERRWGGFGVSGYSSSVHQKTREAVEKDLAERSRIYLTTSGPSTVRKRAKEAKALNAAQAKWAALVPIVLAKPARPTATLGDSAARAVAATLVASIKPRSKPAEKGKGKAKQDDLARNVRIEVAAGGEEDANLGGAVPSSAESLPSGSFPAGSSRKRRNSSSSGEDSDAEGQSQGPPIKVVRHGIGAEDIDVPVKVEAGTEDDPTKISSYDRQAIANRVRMHVQVPALLGDIAGSMPQLRTLQVVRQGTARVDVVEDAMSIEEYAAIFVEPLRKLAHLEHLDLGLAVVGRRELRDFPLSVTIPNTPKNATLILARDLAVRKKLLEADVLRATREGDAWRKRVLDRFVLGKKDEADREKGGSRDGNGDSGDDGDEDDGDDITARPANLAAAGDGAAVPPTRRHRGWPRTVRSGFVYSADLKQRGMHRGVLTSWTKEVMDGEELLALSKEKVVL